MRTALLTLLLSFLYCLSFAQDTSYKQINNFQLSKVVGPHIGFPWDVSVDSEGNIYHAFGLVRKFSPSGNVFHDFTLEGVSYQTLTADRMCLDKLDNIYTVSMTYSKIAKFDRHGKKLFEIGSYGSEPGQFKSPREIVVNSKGEIYVTDENRIQKFDPNGKFIEAIGPNIETATGSYPVGGDFDVDAEDNIYFLTGINEKYRIIKLSPEGKMLQEFGNTEVAAEQLTAPASIAIDKLSGVIYVADLHAGGWQNGGFFVYNKDGSFKKKNFRNSPPGILSGTIQSIALTPQGNVVISDARHHGDSQIVMYSPDGEVMNYWGNIWVTKEFTIDDENNTYLLDYSGNVTKFDINGDVIKGFNITGVNYGVHGATAITVDIFKNVYILNSAKWGTNYNTIFKFDKNGHFIGKFTDFGPNVSSAAFTDICTDATGNLYVSDFYGGVVRKINPKGQYVTSIGGWGYEPGNVWLPRSVAVDMLGIIHILDYNGDRVQQFDPNGKFIRQFGIFNKDSGGLDSDSDLALDGKGNVYVVTNTIKRRLWVSNAKGELLYEKQEPGIGHLAIDRSGSRLLVTDSESDAFTIYIDPNYRLPTSLIQGTVFNDANSNCTLDYNEAGVSGVVIEATPGPYYGLTKEDGSYSIAADSGNYTLRSILPTQKGREIIATCPEQKVKVAGPGLTVQNINFGNKVNLSPYLTASVSSTRRRRCFESSTKVTFSNTGFAAAENARVYLQLPKEVELLSADKTFARLPNGTYVFDVGTLAAGQIGTITIQDKVVCGDESIRGLTVCTKAWISTAIESKCPVVSTIAKCNPATGEVRVVIKNTSPEAMPTSELFRIYLNGQLTTVESYKLAAGDSLVLWIPAGGKTVRLEATQPDCNVSNTLASVTIEGCKLGTDPAPISTGFVNALPPDEEEPEVAEECLLITDSYDPNDKQVTPIGLTEEKYTPTNTALTYKIRFQNTGTDVAYRVVVTDTLSEHLDISTLQLGTASHNYRYEVSGKGRPVLTWTFDNIMLPDSTTNEPGSHGYIQFSIKPKADLPEKTAVENFADIFFDFNSPVRTNTTINRIYDMPDEIKETDRLDAAALIATPVLEDFSPASGKFGAEVILTGKKFSAVTANNKVLFNGVQATVLEASENELKVKVPTNATSGNIKVQTLDGTAHSTTGFEVYQPPVVSGFVPAEGVAGTTVTLQGKYLTEEWLQGIKLGTIACQIVRISGTEVVVKVPGGANTDAFEITSKGGQVQSAGKFRVWHQPAINSLSTVLDKVGATITITGTNFAPEASRNIVWFGTAQASILQASTTTLKVKVPIGATSGIVTLETPGGTAKSPAVFEVIPAPQVYAFTPAAGSVGIEVKLTGAHFLTLGKQDTITFNGQQAIVLEASSEQLTVRVPRGATSGNITVAGIGGQAITTSAFKVEELSPEQAIEVYPNPTNGNFTIRFTHADFEIQEIKLYSALGSLVYTEKVSSPRPEQLDVQLASPKTGIYILHIKTERGLVVKKLHIL